MAGECSKKFVENLNNQDALQIRRNTFKLQKVLRSMIRVITFLITMIIRMNKFMLQ